MKLLVLAGLLQGVLSAQQCTPAEPLLAGGTAAGTLDSASCRLSDGSRYAAYLMALPNRGRIEIDTPADAGLTLHLRDADGTRLERGPSIRRAVEAGRYSLLVSSSQTGPYSVRTAFTGEPDVFCAAFPALGLNRKAAARLGGSGCATPGGGPYDGWSLRTLGSGTLEVMVSAGEFTPSLALRGDDGRALATGEKTLSFGLRGDRRYTLAVLGDKPGQYEISTSFRPSEEDPCRAKASLTGPESRSGTINSQSCSYTVDTSGRQANFDFYEIQAAEPGMAEIGVASSAMDPIVWLLDADGNLAASETLSAGRGRSLLRLPLGAGNYVAMIFSAQAAGGAYTLQYTFTPGPPKFCEPLSLTPGSPASSSLSTDNCRGDYGVAEGWRVTLPAAGTLELAMTSDAFDPRLALRDEKDDVIVLNDNTEGVTDSYLAADVPAGTYTVLAAANAGSGAYGLPSRFTPKEMAACARIEKMEPNTAVIRQLGQSLCRGRNGQPEELYEFTLPESGMVAVALVALQSATFDAFLTLTDPSGAAVRSDDNGYGYGDSLIVQHLPAGTYRAAVRAAQTSLGGAYRLDILFRAGARPPGCSPRATLEPGAPVSGSIQFTGCQLDTDFADVYRFTAAEPSVVELRMESQEFDAHLTLLDAGGSVVEEDDDSGGATDSRLSATVPAGTYFVVARPLSYDPYDSGGAYTLAMTSTAAPAGLATPESADVDDGGNQQNQKIHALHRLPVVDQPGIGQRSQGKKQKAQQRDQHPLVGPLQVVGQKE